MIKNKDHRQGECQRGCRDRAELELKKPTTICDSAGVTNNLILDTMSKLRSEQEEHLATAQKGFMVDGACKARVRRLHDMELLVNGSTILQLGNTTCNPIDQLLFVMLHQTMTPVIVVHDSSRKFTNLKPAIGCGSSSSGWMCKEGNAYRKPSNEPIQSSGDSFEDAPVFERMLEQELVLDDLTHDETSLPCDVHPTLGSSKFQNGAQGEVRPQWLQSTVNIEISFGESLNQERRLKINNSEGEQPRPETKRVLDERPLTIRDRVHKMGYEIRASAAASFPRFDITIPTSLDIRQKCDAEKNETGAPKDPNVATRIRTALPMQLPAIDENTALFLPTAITDRDVDLDRISVLEQEIEDLTGSTEQ
ncbi:MAG: hypothetical protein J3Q66DRAFT_427671 [Benniella sp.]|nr:MAG: hypothetical protein J3Q66DRAFT_427671 [Benniella sp.]